MPLPLYLNHTANSSLVTTDGVFKRSISNILLHHTPRRFKRLIFLASVLAVVEDITHPSNEVITRLNELLSLAHDKSALKLPMYAHSYIWKDTILNIVKPDTDIDNTLNNIVRTKLLIHDYNTLALFFINNAPDWLIYGSVSLLKRDLMILFENLIYISED